MWAEQSQTLEYTFREKVCRSVIPLITCYFDFYF